MPNAAPPHRSRFQRRQPEQKGKHNWQDDRGTTTERGYGYAWQKKRERILKRDKYLCQPHKRRRKLRKASEVDHILAKADGGTDDDHNLEATCGPCHKEKTAKENKKRRNRAKK